MRKVLLATSALVAGSFAVSAANAAAPEMTMFGSIDIQYQGNSSNTAGTAGTNQLGNLTFMNSMHFDVNAEADNGLAYGGRVDWRPAGHSIDELWIDMSGSWGKVVIGQDDSVGDDNVPHAGSVSVGGFGWTGSVVASAGAVGGALQTAEATARNFDSARVSYYTPDFGGFMAGISYTPDDSNGTTTTTSTGAGAVTNTVTADKYDAITELMAKWSGDLGGASLTVAAMTRMADAVSATEEDLSAYEIGATVGVADFTIGANYHDNGDSGIAKTSTATAGEGWSLGVGYSFGDAAVSAAYLSTEIDDAGTTSDEYENLALDVEYTVAEGLKMYAGAQFAESKDGSAATSAKSRALIAGTRLSF